MPVSGVQEAGREAVDGADAGMGERRRGMPAIVAASARPPRIC